ncbi:S8 family peptidase [Simiaoa sp.]|uniref:S8 family peptidase n=1 Tax=Simiaoa sp. TaxID=2944202 RepID=UPI003F7D3EC1
MDQKLENILNLALETPEEEREQTESLNVGYSAETRSWELIVKYHGSLDRLREQNIVVEELIAGYAILTVPEALVDMVSDTPEIEYVEKPKRFYYGQTFPAGTSCFPPVTMRTPFLNGRGVLLAVLDSGITWDLEVFRKADGSTRIRYLWDQTVSEETASMRYGKMPDGFSLGTEYTAEEINAALQMPALDRYRLIPSRDLSGHGTAVAGIAAGKSADGLYTGAAPEAELIVVKLGLPGNSGGVEEGFPRTTEILRGVTYALRKARQLNMPLVINLSFGNSYGSHDGSSLLERFLDNASEIGKTVICVGSGNEGATRGHFAGNITRDSRVELAVGNYERNLNIQLWKNYSDVFRIRLQAPGGEEAELSTNIQGGKYTLELEQTRILVYLGEPLPYAVAQEIYLDMIPAEGSYINAGIWTILLEPVVTVTGQYYLYLPAGNGRGDSTGFYRSTPQVTLTVPSTAAKVITVGAYDPVYDTYADFSGRGYADSTRTIGVAAAGLTKPDLVAPGVNIQAPDVYGTFTPTTGTSFATPIVSGAAALLMEWGIVRGNDPFLYGEKIKAYLRKGARPLRGEMEYPNDRVGYGRLCVADSLPQTGTTEGTILVAHWKQFRNRNEEKQMK